ncbi:MAG TPA: M48 family metalloprotease [Myxococcaceae bacterium]|nr:M48 family metalloprotease [Myxococcaceae bacterium]
MEPIFTPEQLAEIRAYHAPIYARVVIGTLFDLALSFVILRFAIRPLWSLAGRLSGWTRTRLGWMQTAPGLRVPVQAARRLWKGEDALQSVWFANLHFFLLWGIALPRAFYFGYIHERRYGLSQESVWSWWSRGLLDTGISALATALLAFGLFGLARRTRHWWLLLGLGAGMALMGSALIDPYRGTLHFEQAPLPEGPLRERLLGVLEAAEVPVSEIRVRKTSVASERIQAVFAGQGPTRSVILNDVAVRELDADALAAVVAHEAAHVHESRWPRTVMSFFALLFLLWGADRVMRRSAQRGWFSTSTFGDIRTLPLLLFLFSLVATPASLVSKAISRERELAADRYAVALTGAPETFRQMLVKVARVNKMDPDPPRWIVLWGYSHPPLRERLEAVPMEPRPSSAHGVVR